MRSTRENGFPVIGCACPACGDVSLKRKQMKMLLTKLDADHPGIKSSLLKAISNVKTGHLLDRRLLDLDPAAAPGRPAASTARRI